MNYQLQQRLDALAVNYVLGGMHGRARMRFQKLIATDSIVRTTVWRWEQHLNPLAASLPATAPRSEVWQKIQRRLGWLPQEQVINRNTRPLWFSLAAAACVLLAVVFIQPMLTTPVKTEVAVIQTTEAKALWLVSRQEQQLVLKATSAVTAATENDYQLWMLPADGQPPVSLGILPQQGETTVQWPVAALGVDIAALAVSFEPLGGSPTGQPTGPVLFTAEIIAI
ncbi:Anti-sigma-K factor RskA [Arsukibacterium tuosuense]|uniref:Anti-sigma-K factor RskA n=1 Tax=Arsukibacterium tuosuense TaxID=1323745 RepID=A0A285J690_9GAMM|nr:anti-sigma factor [Arsukibacterium tuosuense]SNY55722.1 Anti-sigma-K factor RskA [Arsukibacterium tuosuense]